VREETEAGSTVNKSLIRVIFNVCYNKYEFILLELKGSRK